MRLASLKFVLHTKFKTRRSAFDQEAQKNGLKELKKGLMSRIRCIITADPSSNQGPHRKSQSQCQLPLFSGAIDPNLSSHFNSSFKFFLEIYATY